MRAGRALLDEPARVPERVRAAAEATRGSDAVCARRFVVQIVLEGLSTIGAPEVAHEVAEVLLEGPSVLYLAEDHRLRVALQLIRRGMPAVIPRLCVQAFSAHAEHVPWEQSVLVDGLRCLRSHEPELALDAEADLERYREPTTPPLRSLLDDGAHPPSEDAASPAPPSMTAPASE